MSIREEYCEEAKKLIKITPTLECVEDVEFTVFLRECFLTIRGDLNSGMKTKEGFYLKLLEVRKGIEDGWKEMRAGK